MYFLACNFFKGSYNRFVICYSTLEKNVIANGFVSDYLLNIILYNRIGKPSNQVISLHPFLLEGIQVRFHKNSTTVSQSCRLF